MYITRKIVFISKFNQQRKQKELKGLKKTEVKIEFVGILK